MARVFTIYNCGTKFNRDNRNELIADLAVRTAGRENVDWMINDGPGSAPGGPDYLARGRDGVLGTVHNTAKSSKARAPGTYDPATGAPTANPEWVTRFWGLLAGQGWEENVERTRLTIARMNPKPAVVNMAGWSRGAVTCHMIAHMIHETFGTGIRVNIFAVDPVPGGNVSSHDYTRITIPPCVDDYTAILAEDDRKIGFSPVRVPPTAANAVFHPMPGVHSTMVTGHAEMPEVAILTQALADRFLIEHGTPLAKPIRLSDLEVCEFYAKIRRNVDRYRGLQNGNNGGIWTLWGLAPNKRTVENHVPHGRYFINEHHQSAFERFYPLLYKTFFLFSPTTAQQRGADWATAVSRQLDVLKRTAPNTYQQLIDTGIASHLEPIAVRFGR